VCVQIAATHRALGYLHVDAKEQRLFKQEDVKMLQLFADLAAVALYKSQLFEENLHLDRIDHETGLLKYEPFVEMMRETLDKAKDTNEQLSVLILDVDNYKQIVNTYGYDASKEFLKELGQLTKDAMRSIDVGGRYGRDEMIVMLPHTTPDGAVAVAKALRQKVDERSFTNREIRSTISIGVAAYPQNGSGLEDLLMAGREALFEAQRAGRNKVYHYLTEWSSKERILDKG
jgi:diguanylate cyclase (GGDEF)-like protein